MAKITWANRTDIKAAIGATYEWAAAIANEVKTSINALYDTTEPNTWYVNTSGSDANVGSANFPFLTIQVAHDAAAENDTIRIQNSDYEQTGAVTLTKNITIKGPHESAYSQGGNFPELTNTYTITAGKDIFFENILLNATIFTSTSNYTLDFSTCEIDGIDTGATGRCKFYAKNLVFKSMRHILIRILI